jgi:hypothetical protein
MRSVAGFRSGRRLPDARLRDGCENQRDTSVGEYVLEPTGGSGRSHAGSRAGAVEPRQSCSRNEVIDL